MIREFQGEFRWLSNFTPCKVVLDGIEFGSVEHAYMSAKSRDPRWKHLCTTTRSPGFIKKESRKVQLIDGWDVVKFEVMRKCLEQKFNQEPFRSKLIATGTQHIQEGNWWGDKIWGVCLKTGEGENHLGKMIMEIRKGLTN